MTAHAFIWVVCAFLLALAILIIVHELGHFAAARLCNVKVLRFSLGFGHPLWSRRFGRDGTEWTLSAFPLGGYVKMLDEREGEVAPQDLPHAFNRQSIGKRCLIVVAGPMANLVLAIFLHWVLFVGGVEELRPILGEPAAGTPAAIAKVDAGETVRAVSGVPVTTWSELRWEVLHKILDRESLVLETIDPRQNIAFRRFATDTIDHAMLDGDPMGLLGLRIMRPELPPVIGSIQQASPADAAGLQPGDRVLSLERKPVDNWQMLARSIREAGDRSIRLEVQRKEAVLFIQVTPQMTKDQDGALVGRIGIGARQDPELRSKMLVTVRYDVATSFVKAMHQTWETSLLSLRMIGSMLLGELSVKNVSGPVTIADYAGQSARMGTDHYLRFLAVISISLGVLNLLPIPVLDGGHLMYYLAEFIKGGPLSERVMEIGQQIGFALLAMLMALAFYNDINRLVSG